MTALPDEATKATLDQAADDPKQARSELATLTDKFNTMRSWASGLFGDSGEKTAARSTFGVSYASNQEAIAGQVTDKVVTPAALAAAMEENGGGAWKVIDHQNVAVADTVSAIDWLSISSEYKMLQILWLPSPPAPDNSITSAPSLQIGNGAAVTTDYSYAKINVKKHSASPEIVSENNLSSFRSYDLTGPGHAQIYISGLHDARKTRFTMTDLKYAHEGAFTLSMLAGGQEDETSYNSLHLTNYTGTQFLLIGDYYLLGLK